jgi:hypothetical protein
MTTDEELEELDAVWRRVVAAIPSRYMRGELRAEAFGCRLELGLEVLEARRRRQPVRYLEVGVRLGHSLAYVAAVAANAGVAFEALGVDAWLPDYGAEIQRGPRYVLERLEALSIAPGRVELVTANSHEHLPQLERTFNLILVDGDHSPSGARADLEDCLMLLEPGGLLVFDDAIEQGDDTLLGVWREFIASAPASAVAGERLDGELPGVPGFCWLRKAPPCESP